MTKDKIMTNPLPVLIPAGLLLMIGGCTKERMEVRCIEWTRVEPHEIVMPKNQSTHPGEQRRCVRWAYVKVRVK